MNNYKKYILALITISIPLIIGNISHICIGAIDVIVAAKHSTQTLSAISIANAVMTCVLIAGIGLMAGITPVVSNYLGANQPSKKYLFSTINYALLLALIFSGITLAGLPFLDKMGFEKELIPTVKEYMFIVSFSNFGGYLNFALKEFLQAYEVVILPNVLAVVAVFLNLIFNIAFVFGFWFIPPMGAKGLAVATLIVRTIMGLVLLIYCLKAIDFSIKFEKDYIKNLLKVSCPIATAMILEFMAFNSVTIIMGRVSGLYAAAQSILITITSVTFMVPLALSNAMAIKVGFANGAKNYSDIKKYSLSGSALTFCFMSFCSIILFTFNRQIIHLFTADITLSGIIIPIIYVASVYQVFDGLQVAFSGILKGLKKTKLVTVAMLCGYWIIGIPLGAFFAFKLNLKLLGFWLGLAASLATMSIFMGISIYFMCQKLRKVYVN